MTVYTAVLTIHLLAMSIWMGAGLLAPADVRAALAGGQDGIPPLMGRLRRTAQLMNASAYATVASGLGLIAVGRGFAATPPRIWWALGLTLLTIGVGRWLIRPAVMGIAASAKAPIDAADAERLARKFAMGVHGESVLRVVVLGLMIA